MRDSSKEVCKFSNDLITLRAFRKRNSFEGESVLEAKFEMEQGSRREQQF